MSTVTNFTFVNIKRNSAFSKALAKHNARVVRFLNGCYAIMICDVNERHIYANIGEHWIDLLIDLGWVERNFCTGVYEAA